MFRKAIFVGILIGILGLLAWFSIYAYSYIELFVTDLAKADANVKIAVIGVLASVLLAVYSNSRTKKREIASRQFTLKSATYLKIIEILVRLLREVKSEKEMLTEDLVGELMEFKKELLIWGSPKVIEAWNSYELMADENPDYKKISVQMEKILREIRKDLGHSDWLLRHGSLWGLFLDAKSKKEVYE